MKTFLSTLAALIVFGLLVLGFQSYQTARAKVLKLKYMDAKIAREKVDFEERMRPLREKLVEDRRAGKNVSDEESEIKAMEDGFATRLGNLQYQSGCYLLDKPDPVEVKVVPAN
jgi:hypothetical protein